MERHSLPVCSSKKRISPPIAWNLGLSNKESAKLIRVVLLGQQGVGKTALAVRFATKRFIGEYDCTTERIYKVESYLKCSWEITDPPGYLPTPTEPKLRWADAVVLIYSVSDRVSFEETSRLRFLASRAMKNRKIPPIVMLIGNKSDLSYAPGERVVSALEGRQRAEEIEAHAFHEISVRESVEEVMAVFSDIFKLLAELSGKSGNSRNSGDCDDSGNSGDSGDCDDSGNSFDPGNCGSQSNSFRVRASTDGTLHSLRRPSSSPLKRRLSISVRGTLQ